HPRIGGASFVGAGLKPAPTARGCHHYGRPPDENVRRAGAASPRFCTNQNLTAVERISRNRRAPRFVQEKRLPPENGAEGRIMNRRDFLRSSSAAAFGLGMPADLFAQSPRPAPPTDGRWDAGSVLHILPQVSDTRMLVKASFGAPLMSAPSLRVGDAMVRGR